MASGHVVWGQVEPQDSASSSSEQHTFRNRGSKQQQLTHVNYLPDPSQESSSVDVSGAASSVAGSQRSQVGRRSNGGTPGGPWGDRDDGDFDSGADFQDGDDDASEGVDPGFDGLDETEPIGGIWSKGCDLHQSGTCRPCHYVATKAGCMNGADCEFCHLPHPRRARQRPCKTKRLQFKKVVNRLVEANRNSPEEFAEALQSVTSQSEYLRGLIRKRLHTQSGEEAASSSAGLPAHQQWPDDEERFRGGQSSASSSVGGHRKVILSL